MFSYPRLLCLLMVLDAERVMFSVDYPYSANQEGRDFIVHAPISTGDRERIPPANAEGLLRLAADANR